MIESARRLGKTAFAAVISDSANLYAINGKDQESNLRKILDEIMESTVYGDKVAAAIERGYVLVTSDGKLITVRYYKLMSGAQLRHLQTYLIINGPNYNFEFISSSGSKMLVQSKNVLDGELNFIEPYADKLSSFISVLAGESVRKVILEQSSINEVSDLDYLRMSPESAGWISPDGRVFLFSGSGTIHSRMISLIIKKYNLDYKFDPSMDPRDSAIDQGFIRFLVYRDKSGKGGELMFNMKDSPSTRKILKKQLNSEFLQEGFDVTFVQFDENGSQTGTISGSTKDVVSKL